MTYPPTRATARVTLPTNVVVCPCGLHHMVKGQRVRRRYCELLRLGRWYWR